MLSIDKGVDYDNVLTGIEYHSYKPYVSSTFSNNDEIRIPISQQDIITAPFESYLHITGNLSAKTTADAEAKVKFVNNAIAFLFDEIRYELAGVEIDRTKYLGVTSTIKGILSTQSGEQSMLKNACWVGVGNNLSVKAFSFSVPLRLLLGFAEDYRRVVVNVKQELVLLRSSNDLNAITCEDATALININITNVTWRVPHVTVGDQYRLNLLRMVEKDTAIHVPFRTWEMHEYPLLPAQTTIQSWTVKTSSQMEKPRYVILAFQSDRKNKRSSDMSLFDMCGLKNVRLHLNSQYYPYDNILGDVSIFYEMFARFQGSYYGYNRGALPIDVGTFKDKCPLFVIDCSKQNDTLKVGPVDVRIEFESSDNFGDKVTAYCLLIHDCHIVYTLLTGAVKRMM